MPKNIVDGVDISSCHFWIKERCADNREGICVGEFCSIFRLLKQITDKTEECDKQIKEINTLNGIIKALTDKLKECADAKIRLAELTTNVEVKDCPHRMFNGQTYGCRYYDGCDCDDSDFVNCLFRENARLKQQVEHYRNISDNFINGDYCVNCTAKQVLMDRIKKVNGLAKELLTLTEEEKSENSEQISKA